MPVVGEAFFCLFDSFVLFFAAHTDEQTGEFLPGNGAQSC